MTTAMEKTTNMVSSQKVTATVKDLAMALHTASALAKIKDLTTTLTTVKAMTMAMVKALTMATVNAKLIPIVNMVAATREMLAMVNMMATITAYWVATTKINSMTLTMPFKITFMRARKAMDATEVL